MKKLFTLCLALLGLSGAANAATVDDIRVCKHSYVLVADDYTNNGTGGRAAGNLFGGGLFLDVTGGSVSTGKGSTNLSAVDTLGYVTQYYVDTYGEYGKHLNSLRLKNTQDMIAMRLTAKSKIIIFFEGNASKSGTDARYPRISKNADLIDDASTKEGLNPKPTSESPAYPAGSRWEYTVDDDGLYYIGSYNGDMFVSYIIVEAVEAPGTPTITVGKQTFENGLYFQEVSCQANDMKEEGSDMTTPTVVTYTIDGKRRDIYGSSLNDLKRQVLELLSYMMLTLKRNQLSWKRSMDHWLRMSCQLLMMKNVRN